MEYKNQTENRAFQEMFQVAVKRLQNRSGEDIAAKSGAVFHSNIRQRVSQACSGCSAVTAVRNPTIKRQGNSEIYRRGS